MQQDQDPAPELNDQYLDSDSFNDVEEWDDEEFDDQRLPSTGKRTMLLCNRCNRPEFHLLEPSVHRLIFILTVVGSVGLVYLVGPFRCICCGNRKLFRFSLDPNRVRPTSKRLTTYQKSNVSWEREKRHKKRIDFFRKLTRPIRKLFSKRNMHF